MHLHRLLPLLALLPACAGTTATLPHDAHPQQPAPIAAPTPTPSPSPSPSLDRAALRTALSARRTAQIERLRAYRLAGVFPRNTYSDQVVRVLVDDQGTLCAVANLIALDGHRALVDRTAADNRFISFADVTTGPLHEWVLTSGLTNEEIVAIQLPDSPVLDGRDWEELEQRRLTLHLLDMERRLTEGFDAGVELALTRLAARAELAIALLAPPTPSAG